MQKTAKKGYASGYELYLGEAIPDFTNMTFWVGVKEGDLHGGPVMRHMTSCYRPAQVFEADGALVFKGNALSDDMYVVPECEYRFLQGEGSERWKNSSENESKAHIESVPEVCEPNVRPNTQDARKVAADRPSAPQNDSSCTNQARKHENVVQKTPKRAMGTKKTAQKPKVRRPRRRSCVMKPPKGDYERAMLMIAYRNACPAA